MQLLVLSVGTGIQLFGFFAPIPGRAYELSPSILLSTVTIRHLAVPFLGTALAQKIAVVLRSMIQEGQQPMAAMLLPVVISAGLAVAALRVGVRRPAIWLLGGGALIAGASYFGALQGGIAMIDARAGERYTYAPQGLFALSVLALATTSGRRIATFAYVASGWLLLIGAAQYFVPWSIIAHGPAWRPQVAAWQADPNHSLQIWPVGWAMQLQRLPISR